MKDNWQEYRALHLATLKQARKPTPLGYLWRRPAPSNFVVSMAQTAKQIRRGLNVFIIVEVYIQAGILGGVVIMLGSLASGMLGSELTAFERVLVESITGAGLLMGVVGLLGYLASLMYWRE